MGISGRRGLNHKSNLSILIVSPSNSTEPVSSNSLTILTVSVSRKIGLLYSVANELFLIGLQISTARISTYGVRAVDVFYLKDMTS